MRRETVTYAVPLGSGRRLEYELGPVSIVSSADSVEIQYGDVRSVELEHLGEAGYRCLIRDSEGEVVRIAGPLRAQHAFAAFVDELCLRVSNGSRPVQFLRGCALRFALASLGTIAGIATAVAMFVATAGGGVFGVGSGWLVALPAVGGIAFADWTASVARRNWPAQYEPDRLPFGLAALIGKRISSAEHWSNLFAD